MIQNINIRIENIQINIIQFIILILILENDFIIIY